MPIGIGAILGGAGAAINLVGGIRNLISGSRNERRARIAINNYRRQELVNAFDGVSVSTLGSDLRREENARATSTSVDALRSAGARGLVGGIGQVVRASNIINRETAADLDRQQERINFARANDNVRIRSLQERREEQDLAGLGQQYNVGRQDLASGIGGLGNSIASVGNAIESFSGLSQGRNRNAGSGNIGLSPTPTGFNRVNGNGTHTFRPDFSLFD